MRKLNGIEKSKYIDDRYKEYLSSSFKFGNSTLEKLFVDQLEKEKLFKGPYVDLSLPFERGQSLRKLIDEGVVCKSFLKLGDLHPDRPLYAHQESAIRLIAKGHSAIVTTGTGSGKTESFLYPIMNEILKDIENGQNDVGVRAIFLYPMNALVNDQIDRVRAMLSPYKDITFGFFTGETPETLKKALKERTVETPDNELISREQIRETPPHLLFTNYSMLEYLLLRPKDCSLFSSNNIKHWKYVVLDEAHSYSGSKGIELSLLMRRLTALAQEKPRFILTSATLGEQGKSEDDILRFGNRLTSAKFYKEDIIFSKRIPFEAENVKYAVKSEDYCLLKSNLDSEEKIREITNRYNVDGNGIKELLYNLLVQDQNVYTVYKALKNKCKSFDKIHELYGSEMTVDQLSAMIDLINGAEKNGINIFDLKYHSFVRPLSGAYVTLGEPLKLTFTKTNELDGYKAFEIGNCRYCSSPYIIGKIQRNEDNGLNYLYQNNEVDIYENYGNNKFVKLDYFMLENTVTDEMNEDELEECTLCSKCGCIVAAANKNGVYCDCGEKYNKTVYRVVQKRKEDFRMNNNIKKCPCCGHEGNSGVVRGLNVGKDEGTALISQILYEAMDDGEEYKPKHKKIVLGGLKNKKNDSTENVKQFLAFSDSRQQASFFATFFDSNNARMLRKRLIWSVLEEHGFNSMNVDELASCLEDKIKRYGLFRDTGLSNHKNAWITLLVDLLKVDGSYDGEGMGLYYFDMNISDIMECIDDEAISDAYGKYNITKVDFFTAMQVIFSTFKTTPAVSYVKSTITKEEKKEHLEYRRFDNFVTLQKEKKDNQKNTKSILPVAGKENMAVRYIEKSFGCGVEEAKNIIETMFDLLIQAQDLELETLLIQKHGSMSYQIDVSRYVIKSAKKEKYYRCNKCGRLTPYNIHNVCPQDKCDGVLEECDPDEVLKYNFYRNQYKTMKIEPIIVKEHTAQLDNKTAKEFQKLFAEKKINILSCSTTFEMGIDIGSLEVVFMRNVPPTPANYVQRAGRAGRGKDSSAYILTYCGTGSHDFTYYNEPEKMVSGTITPPYFDVKNKKIIIRHLMACSLGYFFKKNPSYFESADMMIFQDGSDKFKEYMMSHPSDLNEYINKVLPEKEYEPYKNFKWFDEFGGNDEKLQALIDDFKTLSKEFIDAKKQALNEENGTEADYYKDQEEKLHKKNLLECLSQYCVIPKYGFPVDVVDLDVYEEGKKVNKYEMSRDLKVAISEYAPDSEVIVDKHKYTSKYIGLPKTGEFRRNYFCTCPKCKRVNVTSVDGLSKTCSYCGEDISNESSEYYIEPVYGFKTGPTKESAHMKPKRSYSGEVMYLGHGKADNNKIQFGNLMGIETFTEDELLVMNRSVFYMCKECGYSDISTVYPSPQTMIKEHNSYREFKCKNDVLDRVRLAHSFYTDVARFTIPFMDAEDLEGYPKALSFMYAFLEGISTALNIERNDIDGILELNLDEHSYDMLIYDNVPGGAGHVKRLLDKKAIVSVLDHAYDKVNQDCCDEKTSCYNCLRNYYNQIHHNKLRRSYAKEYIKKLKTIEGFDVKSCKGSTESDKAEDDNIGLRPSNYNILPENITYGRCKECLEQLLDLSSDNDILEKLNELISYSEGKKYEDPIVDASLELDITVWPDLYWRKSKVALFLPDNRAEYEKLKIYDWRCFIVDKDLSAENVFKYVDKGAE